MHRSEIPPLEALQAVVTASTAGSFSAAAEQLGLTHGAVSRRVALVEAWAGIRIFTRHGRGVRLTLAGQHTVARFEAAFATIEDGRMGSKFAAGLDTIRVGTVHSFARLWLFPNLGRLEGRPADLRIEPETGDELMQLSDARIAIRYGQGAWPDIEAITLFQERLQPVATPEISEDIGPDPTCERLLRFPLIHDASDLSWRNWLAHQDQSYSRRPIDRTYAGYDLTLLAAAGGHGIAIARDPYGITLRQSLGLVPISPLTIVNPRAFHIVSKPGRKRESVERLLERFLALGAVEGIGGSR